MSSSFPPRRSRSARQPAPPGSVLLTLSEAATSLRVRLPTVRRFMAAGRLPTFWLGRLRRIRRRDLEAFVDGVFTASRAANGASEPFESIHRPPRARRGPDGSMVEGREALRQLRRNRERARKDGNGGPASTSTTGSA